MVHAIYLKSRPKGKWYLVSLTSSPEAATWDRDDALKAAQSEGNDQAEATIQVFDSAFFVPEVLNEVKKQPLLYN